MSTIYVVSGKSLPTRIPLLAPVTVWLLLDRLACPSWLMGVVMTLVGLWVLGALTYRIFGETGVDLFPVANAQSKAAELSQEVGKVVKDQLSKMEDSKHGPQKH